MVPAIIVIVVLAAVSGAVYFLRRAVLNEARANATAAALDLEVKRREKQERLDKEAREARNKEFDEKASQVATTDDALDLLRDAIGRSNAD